MAPNHLADYIRQRAFALDISISELAKRAKLSRQGLYKIFDEQVIEVRLSTLIRLAHVLKVHPIELFRRIFSRRDFSVPYSPGTKHQRDYSGFVRDVTFPDNSIVLIDQNFKKCWEIQNLGDVEWVNRRLVCTDDELYIVKKDSDELIRLADQNLVPEHSEVVIPRTPPGETVSISVNFKAPSFPCTTISYWKMVDEEGDFCFPEMKGLWCKVIVISV